MEAPSREELQRRWIQLYEEVPHLQTPEKSVRQFFDQVVDLAYESIRSNDAGGSSSGGTAAVEHDSLGSASVGAASVSHAERCVDGCGSNVDAVLGEAQDASLVLELQQRAREREWEASLRARLHELDAAVSSVLKTASEWTALPLESGRMSQKDPSLRNASLPPSQIPELGALPLPATTTDVVRGRNSSLPPSRIPELQCIGPGSASRCIQSLAELQSQLSRRAAAQPRLQRVAAELATEPAPAPVVPRKAAGAPRPPSPPAHQGHNSSVRTSDPRGRQPAATAVTGSLGVAAEVSVSRTPSPRPRPAATAAVVLTSSALPERASARQRDRSSPQELPWWTGPCQANASDRDPPRSRAAAARQIAYDGVSAAATAAAMHSTASATAASAEAVRAAARQTRRQSKQADMMLSRFRTALTEIDPTLWQ